MKIAKLIPFMACLTLVGPVIADDAKPPEYAARYNGNGITFDYPKTWEIKEQKIGGRANVVVKNALGTIVILQVHPTDMDPKKAGKLMEDRLRKTYEGKVVAGSEKASKRKIAGEDREGIEMDLEVVKDMAIHLEIESFQIGDKKPVVCMVFQNGAFDADAAKKGFELISGSLSEAK